MKFVVDEQLPTVLARAISAAGYDCTHVFDQQFHGRPDGDIWTYACKHNRVVVTKDIDFVRIQRAQSPPRGRVLWIRLGNCRKPFLISSVIPRLAEIIGMFKRGEWLVEIR